MSPTESSAAPTVSVIVPVHEQAAFVARAISSVMAQSFQDFEILIVDDASTDFPIAPLAQWLHDGRVRVMRSPVNRGLGAALNQGLDVARGQYIAYLPADDVYYPDHLESLVRCLDDTPGLVLACAGLRHHYNRTSLGPGPEAWPQLVQSLHRRTSLRWVERSELVSDNLNWLFWDRLLAVGARGDTGVVTCEWVDHPGQLHKLLREPEGGINRYRQRYRVDHPLRFHSSAGNRIDEEDHYRCFRQRPDTPRAADGLDILLVGELAYNAERVLALEERGHSLRGLWMPEPYWYNTVGPVPFGHVADVPADDWRAALAARPPDVIYALLNWQAVPFCREVLREARRLRIPFVWHFKEGPFICLEKGTWPELADLYRESDGTICSSDEMAEWFDLALGSPPDGPRLVLDGDLPKREWFAGERSALLSRTDGAVHTVVPGRPIGLHPETVAELAAFGVHLHFYGDFTHGQWRAWIERCRGLAPRHLHLHPQVDQERWLREFSQYDAGWLHLFTSANGGDLRRADWDDLNIPARISTYATAGLPMILQSNDGARVAVERVVRAAGCGVFGNSIAALAESLHDQAAMAERRRCIWQERERFTFDAHADRLVAFFRQVVSLCGA